MPKKRHTEEQIISALRQYEGGEKTADICRKLGVSLGGRSLPTNRFERIVE